MQKEGSYFTNKPVLFYVGLGLSGFAALLSLIVATVYGACYAHSVYYSGWGVALPIVGAGLFAAAVTVKVFFNKIPYADVIGAGVLWLLSFLGFILFINTSYLYFSEVFYGGFSAEALANMDAAYIVCLLFFVLAIILSNIGMFMLGAKRVKQTAETEEGVEV